LGGSYYRLYIFAEQVISILENGIFEYNIPIFSSRWSEDGSKRK